MAKKKATKKTTKKAVKKTTKKVVKQTAKKTTKKVAKKATAKKATAKKATAKKATAKKSTAKKATVKKATVKKATAKKATVKKATVKKATAKKATAKNVAPKIESAEVIQTPTLKVGDVAPGFTLSDQNGNPVSLSDFKGKNVVVYFYPKAMTPGCTVQACGLRDTEAGLREADIVVLGISADPVNKLKQFEQKQGLNFKLLSDEGKEVIKAYGCWGPKKFMGKEFDGILRQSFLINKEGNIVHIMHKVDTTTHHEDVINFFKNQG